jgi:hypothetical protein
VKEEEIYEEGHQRLKEEKELPHDFVMDYEEDPHEDEVLVSTPPFDEFI